MVSSSTAALQTPPPRLLLEWKNREAPISQEIIVHNPGRVVRVLVPDASNFMTDLDVSIPNAESAPMAAIFEFVQEIPREQGQAHLDQLEHMMAYFQERDEAIRFAQGLAYTDLERRVQMLEDTLARQLEEGSVGTEENGQPQAMDFEYTKLAILPPPSQLSIPILAAVSENRFTGRRISSNLAWSLDKVKKLRRRRDPSPKKKKTTRLATSRESTPTPETLQRRALVTSIDTPPELRPSERPAEPLPLHPFNTPVAAYQGTPFHHITRPEEEAGYEEYHGREVTEERVEEREGQRVDEEEEEVEF